MNLTVDRLTPLTGAIIGDVDLRTVDDAGLNEIEELLMEHLVLFFPGQALEPEAQRDLALRIGDLDVAPFGPKHPDVAEMTVLDQQAPKGEL